MPSGHLSGSHFRCGALRSRSGTAIPAVMAALMCLMGGTALVLDIGRGVLAVQRCQAVADLAATAGSTALPIAASARSRAADIVTANNATTSAQGVTVDDSDIVVYPPNSANTGLAAPYNSTGPNCSIVKVTGHMQVQYFFANALGIRGAPCSRTAVAVCGPLAGIAISPIWMWFQDGHYDYGVTYNIYEGKEGQVICSFGLAAYVGNGTTDIAHFIQGNRLTPDEILASTFKVGDTLPVTNGNHGGGWRMGFDDAPDGRLYRASLPPYNTQTLTSFTPDNPAIVIVPLLHGDPTIGGSAVVDQFAAFWIQGGKFTGTNSEIWGQFVHYYLPTGSIDPNGLGDVNINVRRLVQ